MKKALSLVLAALMVAGTASVAFAATGNVTFADEKLGVYDDSDSVVEFDKEIRKGDKVCIKLDNTFDTDDEKKEMDKVKVKVDYRSGAELVEKVDIEYLKSKDTDKYGYYVTIDTKKSSDVKLSDLVANVKVYRTSPNNPYDEMQIDFSTVGYDKVTWTEDSEMIVYGKKDGEYIDPVVKFKDIEDTVTITFDGVGEYEINVKDQNNLFLGFNTDVVSEINDKYDYAELEFVNFPGEPAFYRTGLFYLYADDAESFVYALNDGKLEAVKATYDEEYDAYKFALRQFPESLILSDTELEIVNDTTTEGETTTPSETVKPNPGTGR